MEEKNIKNKICTKCKLEKEIKEFSKDIRNKDGYNNWCKKCHKLYYLQNKERNREKKKKYSQIYYKINKEKKIKECKEYNKNHRKEINERRNNKRKEDINHRNKLNENDRIKYKNNIHYRLRMNINVMIRHMLKQNNGSKNGNSILKFLPYTIQELKDHLEKQFNYNMSWSNHGSYWHIDHIIPQSKLSYDSMEHPNFLKCWALENLRPLEAIENIRKSNKIIGVNILNG